MDEQNPITPAEPVAPAAPAPAPAPAEPAPAAPAAPVTEPAPVAAPAATPAAEPAQKKSKAGLVIVIVILLIAIAGGVTAAFLIPMLNKIDYTSAYRKAKDVKELVEEVSDKTNCQKVVKYAESYNSVSKEEYDKYVKGCKTEVDDTIGSSIAALGETDGVTKDKDIKEKYDAFKKEYDKTVAFGERLDEKLAVYQELHAFLVNTKGGAKGFTFFCGCLGCDSPISSDDQIEALAAPLVESENETLASFGETWVTMAKTLRDKGQASYLATKAGGYVCHNTDDHETIYQDYTNYKDNEFGKYVKESLPSSIVIYPLEVPTGDAMSSAFSKLYDAIKNANERNYNSDSHDCVEFMNVVTCE